MSNVSLKRGLGDNSAPAVKNEAKMRKQLLREPEPFDFIDDVNFEFSSFEEHVASGKVDGFRHVLKRLDKSDILVRRKQGQDVAPEVDQCSIFMEYIAVMRTLVDECVAKTSKAKFEELFERMESDSRLVAKQTHLGENSNLTLENTGSPRPHEPRQIETPFSQVNFGSIITSPVEGAAIAAPSPGTITLLTDEQCPKM